MNRWRLTFGEQPTLSGPADHYTVSDRDSVKRTVKHTFVICTVLLLVSLTCRLVWHAARTETGLETLRLQWRDATWGLLFGKRTPIHSQLPSIQARQWLDEIDRIIAGDVSEAELAMGAALVLDNPSQEYVSKYLKSIGTIPGFGIFPTLDNEGLKEVEDAFEKECKTRCLELAAKATEIDPENVDWWRLRALMLWRYSMHAYDDSPRADNWLEILHEASQHDPDNALYDYLSAHFYWAASSEVEFQSMSERFVVTDTERFARGIRHFEQGQKKVIFAVGDAGYSAVERFLSESAIPITEHEKIVGSRLIHIRRSILLRDVWRVHGYRADAVMADGDVRKAFTMQHENLQMLNQFASVGPSAEYDNVAMTLRVSTTHRLNTLASEHREALRAEEIEETLVLEEKDRLSKKVVEQAMREMAKNRLRRSTALVSSAIPSAVLSTLVVEISPSLAVILIMLSMLAIPLSRIGSDQELPKIGVVGLILSFVMAFTCTVAVFGLAPSKVVTPATQAWVLTVLLIASPVAVISWIAWNMLSRRAFKFSLRAMLICILGFSVLFGIVAAARPAAESFTQLPFDLSIPALGWEGLDAKSLENAVSHLSRWRWAVFQWTAYYGQYLTIAIWATIVALLLQFKLNRFYSRTKEVRPSFGNFLGAWARSQGRACLALSTVLAFLYLICAPAVNVEIERHFQESIAFAREPNSHWAKVEQAVARVRADHELMDQLRYTVLLEIAEQRSVEY